MPKFTITEKQNAMSIREGYEFEGTLTQAKRHATRNQAFQGTFLVIEEEDVVVATKDRNAKTWFNVTNY
jgi:hypothetical protein